MSISDTQYAAWLKNQAANRCVLVEVEVKTGGSVVTRYLSNRGYTTGPADTPANTSYAARITSGIKFTRSISLDGGVSLSYGDIELTNVDGGIDTWLDDFWVNRNIRFYLGDLSWARSDFRMVFGGTVTGIDSRKRDRINIKLSDKLQRLNVPVSEVKLGGSSSLADDLRPLTFGEVHNVSPLLVNSAVNEYEVHSGGAIENIIEVRDNGVPVTITPLLSTGRFRLVNQPAGVVTASVQGSVTTDVIDGSNQFSDTGRWPTTRTTATALASGTGPLANSAASAVTVSTADNTHWIQQTVPVDPSKPYAASLFVKLGTSGRVDLQIIDTANSSYLGVALNLFAGTQFMSSLNVHASAYTTTWGAAQVTNDGWYRIWWAGSVNNFSTSLAFRVRIYGPAAEQSYPGDGTSTYVSLYGAQFEQATMPSAFWSSAVADNKIYHNTVAELIRTLASNYGLAINRFGPDEIDLATFIQFDVQYPAPSGVFLGERTNVLQVCNDLAASIGARLIVDSQGRLTLTRLALPAPSTGTAVASMDMVDRSLDISQLAPVVASVKLGYCKNWTVQNNLTTGLVTDHAALFAEEWLTVTRTDSAAATNYNLFTDPTMEMTYLLVVSDATTETQRRLDMYSTQRKVLKYTGLYHLIQEQLGGYQTITHPRFGLAAGKTGQVISITVDWLSPYVDFEVLI